MSLDDFEQTEEEQYEADVQDVVYDNGDAYDFDDGDIFDNYDDGPPYYGCECETCTRLRSYLEPY